MSRPDSSGPGYGPVWWQIFDIWLGGAIAALGAFALLVLIPSGVVVPPGMPPNAISPAFWPKMTAWMLILFGAIVALEGAGLKGSSGDGMDGSRADVGIGEAKDLVRALGGFAFLFAVAGTIGWIGLPVASGVMLLGLGLMFGEHRIALLLALAVLAPAALYYFFTTVANVPIPVGSLFD